MQKAIYNEQLRCYKNINKGKDAVILSTGPTINNYVPIVGENLVIAGVNNIYNYPKLLETLNYYFFGSSYETDSNKRNIIGKMNKKIKKFASTYREGAPTGQGNISPQNAALIDAIPFECGLVDFAEDISEYRILGHSIIFPTLQFLLYTGVKKISIVGCDIVGFYDSTNESHLMEWWKKFKEWVQSAYPNVEIVVVNPVGLKGMFTDLYQSQ